MSENKDERSVAYSPRGVTAPRQASTPLEGPRAPLRGAHTVFPRQLS